MTREEFTNLMVASGPRMLLAVMKVGLDKADAADAVQDAMCRLWSNRKRLNQAESPEAYAMQTAINCARTMIARRHAAMELREDDSIDESAHSALESRDRLQKVMEIIDELPEGQRISIVMRELDGMEVSEIASRMDVSEGNVRVMLSRARKTIKQFFSKE